LWSHTVIVDIITCLEKKHLEFAYIIFLQFFISKVMFLLDVLTYKKIK